MSLQSEGLLFEVFRPEDAAALRAAIRAPWDLIILSDSIPTVNILDTLDQIRDSWPYVDAIVITDHGEEAVLNLLRRGASDVLTRDALARLPYTAARLLRDVRGRKARMRAETQIIRLGRMYRIRSETNQAILRADNSQDLLHEVCQLALRLGPFEKVRVTRSGGPLLVTVAEAGPGESPAFHWEKRVFETGETVVEDDLGASQGGTNRVWESAALFPLRVDGQLWGCLGFYSRMKGFFSSIETSLLQELSQDLGFGLQTRSIQQKRRETDQLLADMTNLLPGLFYKVRWEAPGKYNFLYVSPGIDLLLPYSPEQVRAEPGLVFRAIHPDDQENFARAGRRSGDFLTVFNLEFRLVRPNGTVVWVLATAFPERPDEQGVVWTGLAIDVTPQNRLQAALGREQRLLSVILNNIEDGVVAIDAEENLTLVNRSAARMLDQGSGDLGPWKNLDPKLPWNVQSRFEPWFRRRSDGTTLHLETHVTDLNEADEGTPGKVMLLRDVTERDRIEERLRQSEKLESVGLLAGGVAHDFNNMLTGLFGFIELARMNAEDPSQVIEYLELAMGPFRRARALTQQLLGFAKGSEPSRTVLSLEELLPGILRFTLADGPVAWEIQGDEAPWPVLANEAQVHQVFENLFLNAKQALGPSGGRLTIRLRNVPFPGPQDRGLEPNSYLEVAVEDNGPGMSPEVLSRVFDPFFTTKASGTGLGLSICYSVVKKHGGTVEAESNLGQGSVFRVFLPSPATPGRGGST